ncbi:polysaccharide pyruvyl transferase family protein [Riemerella anatipestifer]|uniref:polysaccharide pyruvyl transferase family protein n=1 Tax=Riemerella anatipestifer TaxID=34085 RepID=UPI0030BA9C80
MENTKKIQKLKDLIIQNLTPIINSDYALIDIPDHDNIGDNLIWEGELSFLNSIPYQKYYECSLTFFDHNCIRPETILLLHGGGNFGDIYPVVNNFRISLIQKYQNHKIIILPQTLHYKSQETLERDSKIINEHPNITICVRDEKSESLAKQYFSNATILLLPDMAFCIDLHKIQTNKKGNKILVMDRKDNENIPLNINIEQEYDLLDWPTFNTTKEERYKKLRFEHRLDRIALMIQRHSPFSKYIDSRYGLKNKKRREKFIEMGTSFFSDYRKIYTTRLHGMILAVLMGKEVVILDNSYGKLSSYHNTWLKDFDNIYKI